MAKKSAKKALGGPAAPRPKAPPPVRSDAAAGRGDNRRLMLYGAIAVVVLVAVVLALVLTNKGSSNSATRTIPWAKLGQLQTGPPPWNNGVGSLTDRLAPIGLSQLGSEGSVLHIHQHLDLYVQGKKVALPPLIGIYDNSYITEVHVHDASGVIHVESPTKKDFTLGQMFGEWGVKLTASCVGKYCGHVQWWLNGKKQTGDPANLVLKAHQEIAIAAGSPPLVVPKSYKFPAGE